MEEQSGGANQTQHLFLTGLIKSSFIGCIVIIFLSICVLLGWTINNEVLKSVIPGYLAMNPVEALTFIFASIALLLRLEQKELTGVKITLINFLAFLLLFVGVITLLSVFSLIPFRIDTFLFSASLGKSLISPNSGFNFVLIGCSLLVWNKHISKTFQMAQFFTLIAGIITMFAGIGYLYDVLSFYQFSSYSAMPLNTTSAFALLCFCILVSTHNYGMMKILTEDFQVSKLARRLVLLVIALPIILGCLRISGQTFLDTQTGTALMVVAQIIIFTVVIWILAKVLYVDELRTKQMTGQLKENNLQLEKTQRELKQNINELESAKKRIQDLLNHQQTLQDILSAKE